MGSAAGVPSTLSGPRILAGEPRDLLAGAHERHERAVCAGCEVGVGAAHRLADALLGRTVGERGRVRAGIDHERYASGLRRRTRRPQSIDLLLEREQLSPVRVLEVHSDRARLDHRRGRLRSRRRALAIARLDVGGDRRLDRRGDAPDHIEHLGAADVLPIGVAEHVGDAGAGGRDRREPGCGDAARAPHVPGVREDQHLGPGVQPAQHLGLLFQRGGHAGVCSRGQRGAQTRACAMLAGP